jgi:ubiquinone/menaquinone biosynthesis C-methylase UbiE
MSIGDRFFAMYYDRFMSGTEKAGLRDKRTALLGSAKGDVLEIGAGTGANLALYPSTITSLTVTEPDAAMMRKLQKRLADRDVMALRAPAEDLPFDNDSFDTVVSTLTLCTVDDQPRALREIHRVLRPGGRLLFIEHVRAEDEKLARKQDRMNGINRIVAHGCNCNRPTLDGVRAAGFTLGSVEHGSLEKAPSFVRPLVVGLAEVA